MNDATTSIVPEPDFSPLEINVPLATLLRQQTGSPDSSTAPALTGVSSEGMQNPVPRPAVMATSVVAKKRPKDVSRCDLPVARTTKLTTAAAVADELARGWPKGRSDVGGIASGGYEGDNTGITSKEEHMFRTVLQDASCPGSKTYSSVVENNGGGKTTMLLSNGGHDEAKEEGKSTRELDGAIMVWDSHSPVSEVSGVSTVAVEVSEPDVGSADTAAIEKTEAGIERSQARSYLTETRTTRAIAHRTGRRTINTGVVKRWSAAMERVRNSWTDTTNTTVGVMTKERLAAAQSAIAAAEMAKSKRMREGLIKIVGRPKRGPCMLTLTASAQTETAAVNSDRARSKSTWQPEATGGLLGPGESKILVC